MNDGTVNKALNLCYFYLKFRARTEREIREYLARKSPRFGFTQQIIDDAVASLKDENLINDEEFVRAFVRTKLVNAHKSLTFIRSKLLKLGIPSALITETLESQDVDESESAYQAVISRWERWKGFDPAIRRQRAYRFLLGRGFTYGIVKQVIRRCSEG